MKVLEKLVLTEWLLPLLQRPFSPCQFAFIPWIKYRGCCNALTLAKIWTAKALDEGASYVSWLAIDFRKAFDSVSHKMILDTLVNHFCVSNSVVLWIQDYLTGRMQGVITNNSSTSPYLTCGSGVPQGSILGPVLFAMLLDPCLHSSIKTKMIAYADDCTLLHKVMPLEHDTLQDEADLFVKSALTQGLEINPSKCQIIHFLSTHFPSPTAPPLILLHGNPLSPVKSIKILGVSFTSDLKWNTHLLYVYKKCARAAYFIKLLHTRGVKGSLLRSACSALVFSHLTYCWPVFCECLLRDLRPLLNLEKRLSKLCNHPIYDEGLKSYLDNQCVRLARRISKLDGHPLEECFLRNPSVSTMQLRNTKKFVPLPAKYAAFKNSFTKFAC
jgi:hypothetical protein